MELSIRNVQDTEDHESERLLIDVEADCNLASFIVFDSTYTAQNTISNKIRHSYWFWGKNVKKGDLVVLHTTSGVDSSNETGDVHHFYWNLGNNVWNNDHDGASIVKIAGRITKKII